MSRGRREHPRFNTCLASAAAIALLLALFSALYLYYVVCSH